MESVQDLLAPEKVNIPINDDPKTGEVSLAGASVTKIQDLDHFLQLLQIGEANRYAANTKLNTESSRSHAILMVSIVYDWIFVNLFFKFGRLEVNTFFLFCFFNPRSLISMHDYMLCRFMSEDLSVNM